MKVVALCLVALVVCAQADDIQQQWKDFQVKYGKTYRSPVEARKRFTIFQENVNEIEKHNALYEQGKVSYKEGINQFADLTADEFMQYVNRGLLNKPTIVGTVYNVTKNFVAPASVDWRQQGVVTGVKDQGQCGACWAFSTTGSIEGQLGVVKSNLVSLSEQNLMDCSWLQGNAGCGGGLMTSAFNYVKKNGIESEQDYPYLERDGVCKADSSKVVTKISGYVNIPEGDEEALQNAIATVGPISVAIDATNTLQRYDSGILNDRTCNSYSLNHGVLAVGYGTQDGTEYYIVKNSWGASWGENGYFRLVRNQNNKCGIASEASYPVL
ncbi:hypothetical protein HHI36_014985 [Cryptolaemus montrouzieri]|uniref:Cathepsin L n=1 Tax=Cryptolaemus montrouzieri TaxID=559131 RepID=A0ABD2N5G3_9CUCU